MTSIDSSYYEDESDSGEEDPDFEKYFCALDSCELSKLQSFICGGSSAFYDGKPHSLYYSTMSISSDSYTYDGTEKKPDITVTNEYGETLVCGKDYEIEYSDNIEVGTATVIVTGTRNYIGTMTKTFVIVDGEPEECSHFSR